MATRGPKVGSSRKAAKASSLDALSAPADAVSAPDRLMDMPLPRRHLLRLDGVTKSDFVEPEDRADQLILEQAEDNQYEPPAAIHIQTHEKIPTTFTTLDDWPLTTSLCCYECGLTFTDRPKFIPTFIQAASGTSRVEMGVQGFYCSWACAELWIETRHVSSNEHRWRLQDNLRHAFTMFTGRHIAQIRAAHSRHELQQYGGEFEMNVWLRRNREIEPDTTPNFETKVVLATTPKWGNAWNSNDSGVKNGGMPTITDGAQPDSKTLTDGELDELLNGFGF